MFIEERVTLIGQTNAIKRWPATQVETHYGDFGAHGLSCIMECDLLNKVTAKKA